MIEDDNVDCADYEDRGYGDDPSDGASTASMVDDNMDERIADKVDDMAVAGSSCKWDAAASELREHSAVVEDRVRIDTVAGRKLDWAASSAECVDSVLAAAEPAWPENLALPDAVASNDSPASPADGGCAGWVPPMRTPAAYSAEWNSRSRLRSRPPLQPQPPLPWPSWLVVEASVPAALMVVAAVIAVVAAVAVAAVAATAAPDVVEQIASDAVGAAVAVVDAAASAEEADAVAEKAMVDVAAADAAMFASVADADAVESD